MYNNYEEMVYMTSNNSTLSILGVLIIVFSLILSIIMIISYWKILKKAGKPGWSILVPIYNIIVLIQISGLSMIYLLLLFIPIVQLYAYFKIMIEIAKKFNKSSGFGVGLSLLPVIFLPLLAFSDSTYNQQTSEPNNETTNNEFNAINVINENNTDVNISNDAPSLSIENSTIEEPINIDSTENNLVNEEVLTNNDQNIDNNIDAIPNNLEVDNNISDMGNTETNPINLEPLEEPVNTVPSVEMESTDVLDSSNIEVQSNTVDNDASSNIENINEEQNVSTQLDAGLDQIKLEEPIIEQEVNELNNTSVDTVQNAYNSKPIINNENDTAEKICKNCGEKMPDIVSICPNCGTENE